MKREYVHVVRIKCGKEMIPLEKKLAEVGIKINPKIGSSSSYIFSEGLGYKMYPSSEKEAKEAVRIINTKLSPTCSAVYLKFDAIPNLLKDRPLHITYF